MPNELYQSNIEDPVQPSNFNSISKTIEDADDNYISNFVRTNRSHQPDDETEFDDFFIPDSDISKTDRSYKTFTKGNPS